MNQITIRPTTCLFFLFISLYVFISSFDKTMYSSGYYVSAILILLVSIMVIFVVRTTIVTWITVMVLLAFAGKRRRVLVKEGRKITSDVAMYLARDLVKERGFVAFACAAIFSLVTMACL
ncbi:hypothetical protein CASFOL_038393 [Castilleja foliolosa]|uniref:Uncharacterized protein n=1 Tax=Castilleja foliolosa TaxID=1961234 RepID=A0ABD3BLA5_9LAMI